MATAHLMIYSESKKLKGPNFINLKSCVNILGPGISVPGTSANTV